MKTQIMVYVNSHNLEHMEGISSHHFIPGNDYYPLRDYAQIEITAIIIPALLKNNTTFSFIYRMVFFIFRGLGRITDSPIISEGKGIIYRLLDIDISRLCPIKEE